MQFQSLVSDIFHTVTDFSIEQLSGGSVVLYRKNEFRHRKTANYYDFIMVEPAQGYQDASIITSARIYPVHHDDDNVLRYGWQFFAGPTDFQQASEARKMASVFMHDRTIDRETRCYYNEDVCNVLQNVT